MINFAVASVSINTGKVKYLNEVWANEADAKKASERLNEQFKGIVKSFVVVYKSLDKGTET